MRLNRKHILTRLDEDTVPFESEPGMMIEPKKRPGENVPEPEHRTRVDLSFGDTAWNPAEGVAPFNGPAQVLYVRNPDDASVVAHYWDGPGA